MSSSTTRQLREMHAQCWCADKDEFFRCSECRNLLEAADELDRLRAENTRYRELDRIQWRNNETAT